MEDICDASEPLITRSDSIGFSLRISRAFRAGDVTFCVVCALTCGAAPSGMGAASGSMAADVPWCPHRRCTAGSTAPACRGRACKMWYVQPANYRSAMNARKVIAAAGAAAMLLGISPSPVSAYFKLVIKNCEWDVPERRAYCNYIRKEVDHSRTDIWCEHPGPVPCPHPPLAVKRTEDGREFVDEDEQRCVDYAVEQIAAGNLNGEWVDPSSGKRVVWSATAPTGGNMTIEVTP